MNKDIGFAPFFLALGLIVCAGLVLWGIISKNGYYEVRVNNIYEETVAFKIKAMKTIVFVDGEERLDCALQRGDSTIVCKQNPQLTLTEDKKVLPNNPSPIKRK